MILRALPIILLAQALSAAPAWRWRTHRLPRVLAVQGLWHEEYRLPKALSEAGGADLREALHFHGSRSSDLHFLRGEGMHGFPKSAEELLDCDLLVLTNVAARAFSEQQTAMLKDFVTNGSGLLLLGGYWTLDKGGMRGTPFEELLSIRVVGDGGRLPHEPKGIALKPIGKHPVLALPDWSAAPAVFFHNRVQPKEGVAVLVAAGEHPMLILGTCGAGRTAVFAGTVCGVPPEGVTPFWEWEGWPTFLAGAIEWLWTPRRQMMQPPAPESGVAGGLSEAEREDLAFAEGEEKLKLIQKAVAGCDAETAGALLDELAENEALSTELQAAIMKAIGPYAEASWAEMLLPMKTRTDPSFRRGWLELLGATGSPQALPLLLGSLDDADLDVRRAALSGLASLHSPKAVPILKRLQARQGALEIEAATTEGQFRTDLPGPKDLRIDVLLALYRSGAHGTPRQMLNTYDQYLFYAEYASAFLRSKGPGPSDKQGRLIRKEMAYRHQFLRRQLARMERLFIEIPAGLEPDFVSAANAEQRPHCLRLVYRALESSLKPSNAARFVDLCRAQDSGVARLGVTTVLETRDAKLQERLLAALTQEWRTAEAPRRRRLLMLARLLPPNAQQEILAMAQRDSDPGVKRAAEAVLGRGMRE